MCPSPIDGFAKQTFKRIDADNDQQVTGDEIKQHLKNLDVPGGFLGMVHSGAVDQFMDTYDKSGDQKITLDEFVGESQSVLPKGIYDADGKVIPGKVEAEFDDMDANDDGRVDVKELKDYSYEALKQEGGSHLKIKADIAGKLGVDALDTDRDGAVSKTEFLKAADEAQK